MTHTETRPLDTTELIECARRCAASTTRDYGVACEPSVPMPDRGVTMLRRCEGWCRDLVDLAGQYSTVLTAQPLLSDSDELAPWYRFELIVGDFPSKVLAGAGLNRQRPIAEDPVAWSEAEQILNRLGELIECTRSHLATR